MIFWVLGIQVIKWFNLLLEPVLFVALHHIALWVSLYWEGDLRNLSYFLNKRKELEFNN